MPKLPVSRNQSDLQQRLKRHRMSGLTIPQFCQQEKVTASAFYYWNRKLRSRGQAPEAGSSSRARRSGSSPVRSTKPSHGTRSEVESKPRDQQVQFRWDTGLHVSLPADCLDAIRCLLDWSRDGLERPDETSGQSRPFHQVLVDTQK